jgi:hypothetical protein
MIIRLEKQSNSLLISRMCVKRRRGIS